MSIHIIAAALGAVVLLLSADELLHHLNKRDVTQEPQPVELQEPVAVPWQQTSDSSDRLAA